MYGASLLPLAAALLAAASALAQSTDEPRPRSDLGAFVDSIVPALMDELGIPGAVITVVDRGTIAVRRGFGTANLESGAPADPGTTLYRVGSISKVMTTIAALQLVEEGRLELDRDVNDYLDGFRVRPAFSTPVTMRQLLTHSAGLDRRYIGTVARTPDGVRPLDEYLADRLPPRVRPPGEFFVYSDNGMTLAGHVVERVAGRPFAEHVEARVLAPVGMHASTFAPLPDDTTRLAFSYFWRDGGWVRNPIGYPNVVPAGGLITTADDMARFIITVLGRGTIEGEHAFSERLVEVMSQRHFVHHEEMPGAALGFYEDLNYGQRALRHDGWMSGLSSLMHLVPESDIGFFVALSADPDLRFRNAFVHAFATSFIPAHRRVAPEESPLPPEALQRFAGSYRQLQYAERGLERASNILLARTVHVSPGGDRLTLHVPGQDIDVVPLDSLLFARADGWGNVAFRENGGRVRHLIMGMDVYERIGPLDGVAAHRNIALVLLLILATAPPIWLVAALVRRLRGRPASPMPAVATMAVGGAASVLYVAMVVRMAPAFVWPRTRELAYGIPAAMEIALTLALLGALLSVALVPLVVLAWRRRYWSMLTRLHVTVLTMAALLFALELARVGILTAPGGREPHGALTERAAVRATDG